MPFKDNKIKLAACIVTYNSALDDVIAAAKSFLDSKLETRLTIVDNQSEGGYLEKLQERMRDQKNIRFTNSGANKGFGFGHNIAINQAPCCDYYLVLNPDIVIHEGTVEGLVDFMDNHPDVGLVGPKILNQDGSCQHLNKRLPTVFDMFARRFLPERIQKIRIIQQRMDHYVMKDKGYDKLQEVPYMSGCFMLFRKSLLDELGGFDEHFFMYLEDADITIRMGKKARTVFFPDVAVTHLWARDAHRNLKLTWVMIKSTYYFFSKWGWRWI